LLDRAERAVATGGHPQRQTCLLPREERGPHHTTPHQLLCSARDRGTSPDTWAFHVPARARVVSVTSAWGARGGRGVLLSCMPPLLRSPISLGTRRPCVLNLWCSVLGAPPPNGRTRPGLARCRPPAPVVDRIGAGVWMLEGWLGFHEWRHGRRTNLFAGGDKFDSWPDFGSAGEWCVWLITREQRGATVRCRETYGAQGVQVQRVVG
jgi:hypothetical protein